MTTDTQSLPYAYTTRSGRFDPAHCRGSVSTVNFSGSQCDKKPTYFEQAQWSVRNGTRPDGFPAYDTVTGEAGYCGTHAPSRVAARRDKKNAELQAEARHARFIADRARAIDAIRKEFEAVGRELATTSLDDAPALAALISRAEDARSRLQALNAATY